GSGGDGSIDQAERRKAWIIVRQVVVGLHMAFGQAEAGIRRSADDGLVGGQGVGGQNVGPGAGGSRRGVGIGGRGRASDRESQRLRNRAANAGGLRDANGVSTGGASKISP